MSQAKMKESPVMQLEPPRFDNGKALLIAGLRRSYTGEMTKKIATQWQSVAPHIGKIPGQVGRVSYGVCWNRGEATEYLTGVEISNSSGLPSEFNVVEIPAQRFAVFAHRGHVSRLYETCAAIPDWFAGSGYKAAGGIGETTDFF